MTIIPSLGFRLGGVVAGSFNFEQVGAKSLNIGQGRWQLHFSPLCTVDLLQLEGSLRH